MTAMPGAKRSGKRKFSKDGHSAEAELKRQCMPLTDNKRSAGSRQASALGDPGQIDDNTYTCNADTVVATLTNADYGSCSEGSAKDDVEQPNTAENTNVETERRVDIEPTSKDKKSEEIPASTENNSAFGDAKIHEVMEENDRHSTMHLNVSEQTPGESATEHVQCDQTGDGKHNSNNFGAGPRSDLDSVAERTPLHQQEEKDKPAENNKAEVTNQIRDCGEIVKSSPGREGEDVRIVENRDGLDTNDEVDLKVMESSKSSMPSTNTEGVTVQANIAHREAKDKETIEEFCGNEFTRPPVDLVFSPKKVDTHGLNAASRDQPMSQDKSERLDTQHGNTNQTAVERSFQAEPGPEQKCNAGNPATFGFIRSNVETTRQGGDNIKEHTKAKTGVDGVRCSELLKGGELNGCPARGTEEDTPFADGSVFEMDVTESQLCAVPDDIFEQEEVAMDRAAETRRQQQEDREKKAVQTILGSLLKMNDLVIKTRREMETIKRRYQGLGGGIGHEKPK